MRKWILSIMFAICMVIIFMPQAAFAANTDHTYLQSKLTAGGTVKLEKDYTIDSTLEVTSLKGVTLDLNGHVIKMSESSSGSVIRVNNGASLTLQDSSPAAAHDGDNASLPYGGVLTGGSVGDSNYYSDGGGGVNVVQGSFTMNGGTIYGCTAAKYGGGVNVTNSSFTMNGGTIYGCTAKYGGGVRIDSNSFTMTGGIIENCAASSSGDAVLTGFNVTFSADGGTIIGTVALGSDAKIESRNSSGTRFYGAVEEGGTISGGIYYGGISSSVKKEGAYKTVSFDLNGGNGYIPDQWFFNGSTARVLSPADPTKEGYQSFDGWYNGNTKYDFIQPVTNNITLTAKYSNPKTYNISYTLNGGTATNPTSYTVESDTITLNNPTKPGYTFTGWSVTGLSDEKNTTVIIPKGSTGARTYTANWTLDTYNISYNLNGGTAANQASYFVESGPITLNNPTKPGYTFTGWSGTDLTGENNTTVTISKGSTGNREYTAHWTQDTYEITYHLNDGEAPNSQNPTSYTVESEAIELNNPTKPGYTFTGWNGTGINGRDLKYVIIPNGSTGNREYAADWTPEIYVVTLNTNGGKINSGNVTDYTYGQGATLPTDVTKAGYTFKGWYDNENFTGDPVTTISDTDTEKKEYWAKWAAISYPSISQKPAIEAGEGVKVTLSADGTVATITFDDGYELTDVVLNGVSKGKVTEIKGLKTGDKLVVTAAKKETEPTDPAKEKILAKLSEQKLAARSALVTMNNGKKAVCITWYNRSGEMMDFDGVEIYRSTKKNSGYGKKPIFTSKTDKYTNTSVKVGTRYYYKVRGFVIIDGQKYYTDYSLKAIRTVK